MKIKENIVVDNKFKFDAATEDEIYSKLKSLDPKKAYMERDIPAKVLIGTNDIISNYLLKIYSVSKNSENFPTSLKTADVAPKRREL